MGLLGRIHPAAGRHELASWLAQEDLEPASLPTARNGLRDSPFIECLLLFLLRAASSTAGSASLLGNQMFGPYGKQRYSKGTIPTTKGYTGQYGDALTGLDSYVARYYDAVVGRFLSADTVESNLEGMDPYAYVGGNPQTMNDPTGHADENFMYLALWYEFLHFTERVRFSTPGGLSTYWKVPGGPRTFPDIVNDSERIIWEAKTGQGEERFIDGFGPIITTTTDWPDPDYVADEYDDYALREANGWAQYPLATLNTDRGFAHQACLATFDGCPVFFLDGSIMHARVQSQVIRKSGIIVPIKGIIEYKMTQKRLDENLAPAVISALEYLLRYGRIVPAPKIGRKPKPQPQPRFYTVRPGDTLWGIALSLYGSSAGWQSLYTKNARTIGGNPGLIFPGQRLAY
jgi:RHS repeat-associated protein